MKAEQLHEERKSQRVAKGRTALRIFHQQIDVGGRYRLPPTVAPDPMWNLAVARMNRATPHGAMRYGELLQLVVSPLSVKLP